MAGVVVVVDGCFFFRCGVVALNAKNVAHDDADESFYNDAPSVRSCRIYAQTTAPVRSCLYAWVSMQIDIDMSVVLGQIKAFRRIVDRAHIL